VTLKKASAAVSQDARALIALLYFCDDEINRMQMRLA